MARTTVDIDASILRELKKLQAREGRSLGSMMSELLAEALARRKTSGSASTDRFVWHSRPMRARVDLSDKEAVWAALDRTDRPE